MYAYIHGHMVERCWKHPTKFSFWHGLWCFCRCLDILFFGPYGRSKFWPSKNGFISKSRQGNQFSISGTTNERSLYSQQTENEKFRRSLQKVFWNQVLKDVQKTSALPHDGWIPLQNMSGSVIRSCGLAAAWRTWPIWIHIGWRLSHFDLIIISLDYISLDSNPQKR